MSTTTRILLLLTAGAALGSCAPTATQRDAPREQVQDQRGGSLGLDLLATLNARPPATNTGSIASITPAQAVDALSDPIEPAAPRTRPLDPEAARLYANARGVLAQGDAAQAIELLRRAHEQDDGSASIAAALAEALVFADNRSQASDVFHDAYTLGDRSPLTLLWVAQGSTLPVEERIACAHAAYTAADRTGASPASRTVSGVVLGRLLLQRGAAAAGIRVLDDAMGTLGPRSLSDPALRREVIELSTRRSEIVTLTGDAALALGDPQDALDRYERAGTSITRPPPALIVRRVAALLDAGDLAAAAASFVDAVTSDPGVIGAETRTAMRVIARDTRASVAFADAIDAVVRDPDTYQSLRLRLLTHRVLAASSTGDAERALADAPGDALSALAGAAVLRGSSSPAQRNSAAARIASQNPDAAPHLGEALSSIDGDPARLIGEFGAINSPGATRIARSLAASLGRADLVEPYSGSPERLAPTPALAEIRLMTQRREYGVTRAIAEYQLKQTESMTPAQRARLLSTLDESGWRSLAGPLVERIRSAPEPGVDELIALAFAESRRGDNDAHLNALERAISADPYDERAFEGLVSIRGASGALPDEDELRVVVRDLSTSLPASPLVSLIRAGETAAQGLVAEAERALLDLNERTPEQQVGIDLLLRLWRTMDEQGDGDALERGLDWIDARAEETPGSVTLIRARAQLLNTMGRRDDARRLLLGASERIPSRTVERLHEGIVRLDDSARADELALERVAAAPIGIDRGAERLEISARAGSLGALAPDDVFPSDAPVELSALQARRVVSTLSQSVQGSIEHDDLVLELATRALAMTESPDVRGALLQISIVAMAGSESFTPASFERLVRRANEEPTGDADPSVIAIQALTRAGRMSEATDLLARLSVVDGEVRPNRLADLLSVLSRDADADAARRVIAYFEDRGLTKQAAEIAQRSLGTSERPDKDEGDPRADLLYCVAVVAMFFERDEHAIELYRQALTYNPDHVWVLNDLGYHLVERGESLDEARSMLERAYAQLPNNASVTDSYAWALYAMGVIADDGAAPGARTLLEKASRLDASNATVHDHLGDARWMLGDHAGAIDAWLRAEATLRDRLKAAALQENPNADAMRALREELRGIRYKITDTESGAAPAVAPSRAEPVPPRDGAAGDIEER